MKVDGRAGLTLLTLLVALLGFTLSPRVTSEALACEKQRDDECVEGPQNPGNPSPDALTIRGTVQFGLLEEPANAFSIDARLDGDVASGTATINGLTGPVLDIVPPSGDRDYYCVEFDLPAPDDRYISFIRDVGDGVLTRDEYDDRAATEELTCRNGGPAVPGPTNLGDIKVSRG